MIVCMCQWELNPRADSMLVPLIQSEARASSFLQSFRDSCLHCMKILAASFIYSVFLPFLLPWCFRNVSILKGDYFHQIKATCLFITLFAVTFVTSAGRHILDRLFNLKIWYRGYGI